MNASLGQLYDSCCAISDTGNFRSEVSEGTVATCSRRRDILSVVLQDLRSGRGISLSVTVLPGCIII